LSLPATLKKIKNNLNTVTQPDDAAGGGNGGGSNGCDRYKKRKLDPDDWKNERNSEQLEGFKCKQVRHGTTTSRHNAQRNAQTGTTK
jgi:hypothetical protein